MKKIGKYIVIFLVCIFGLLVVLPALLYIPALQTRLKNLAIEYAARQTGMHISAERLRLSFPFDLVIDRSQVITAQGDTLLDAQELKLDIALMPLLRKRIKIEQFSFRNTRFDYADTTSQFHISGDVQRLVLSVNPADLTTRRVTVPRIMLRGGRVDLALGDSPPDTTKSDPLQWVFDVRKLTLKESVFTLQMTRPCTRLYAEVGNASLKQGVVDLGKQTVDVNSVQIEQGKYAYFTGKDDAPATPADTLSEPSPLWTVQVNQIKLTDNRAEYGQLLHQPRPGFDPDYISARNINIAIDSLFNRGSEIKARLQQLSFTERSGLAVVQGNGLFLMDSTRLSLEKFRLRTTASDIQAEAGLSPVLADGIPFLLHMNARIGLADLYAFDPQMQQELNLLPAEKLSADIRLQGISENIDIRKLDISLPDRVEFTGTGNIRQAARPARMNGDFRWKSRLANLDFVRSFIPDTALQKRIEIPHDMRFFGRAEVNGYTWLPDAHLLVNRGRLNLSGNINPQKETYDMALRLDSFPVQDFLPQDSLGRFSLQAQAQGKGFDFLSGKTDADATLYVAQARYNGCNYQNITLSAQLQDGMLNGTLTGNSAPTEMALKIDGTLQPEQIQASLSGRIDRLDLQQMNFTSSPLSLAMNIEAEGASDLQENHSARIGLTDFVMQSGDKTDKLQAVSLEAHTDDHHIHTQFTADNMSVHFDALVGIDAFTAGIENTRQLLDKQLHEWRFDLAALEQQFPPFTFSAQASKNGFLKSLLEPSGIGFKQLGVEIGSSEEHPFHVRADIDQLVTGGVRLDTIRMYARQGRDSTKIVYRLHVGNAPGNLDPAAQVRFSGYVETNHLLMKCRQENRAGEQGFDFGYEALLQDSLIHITLLPDPILGFETWSVNDSNFVDFFFDKQLYADMRLNAPGKSIVLGPAHVSHFKPGTLNVSVKGLDIASILSISPFAPPLGGILSTNLNLYLPQNQVDVKGILDVDGLTYDKQRVGDIGFGINYRLDSLDRQQAYANMMVNNIKVLTLSGSYDTRTDSPADITVDIPGFPLETANPFLSGTTRLQGTLHGNMKITGDIDAPRLNGYLQLASATASVPMIGTSFGFSPDRIDITDNLILFRKYALTGPNQKPLYINGNVDCSDFSRILTDLALTAKEFQLINVARNKKTDIYGKAFADMDLTVKGVVDNLVLRGNVGLLNGTDATYVMQDSPLDIKQERQNMVTFVSFSDTTEVEEDEEIKIARIGGIDMLVNVNVGNAVKLAVNLSADGKNRINLQGGGNLTYAMNVLGDSRFSGRYELTGGTVRYSPPVISEINFNIQSGSYVSWNGDIADPNLNITAVNPMRINVTDDDKSSRPVTFNVIINIKNTLENLSITFDVSAPEDLTIQNELTSMTAEQRASQAMNLLIYNSYSGPGSSSAKISAENSLNSFIAKELNQWAQSNLKNIDISFGIDSYNDISSSSGTHTDYSYKVSKSLFNDRFKIVIGGSFSPDENANQNLKENLIDDISLEYMLDKRDNMLLKLFHHTGFESILEGEVTQTGVGFVVRKKLFKLKELFHLSTFQNKKEKKEKK
ncbi:MAG: translocation/assembly module TamB domain-containing protein [Coprobacter sp.]|nr:translocation/assembly module TamB domain-containing protein [Coprobacter sp.]